MTPTTRFLLDNYYSKYSKIPTPPTDVIEQAVNMHKDRMVIIRDENIKGIGVYLTLTDETYAVLGQLEIADEVTAKRLWDEKGRNVHFIILAADCLNTILAGMNEVIEREHPKTISWFNPTHTHLHTRRF